MSYSGNALFLEKKNMNWTIRPSDNWTFFEDFLTIFGLIFGPFFWVILLTICGGGGGERGRKIISMRQTFINQGGVGDGLLIRMEGWEVVVVATASY